MYLADVLTLDAPKRTRDGYLAVRAKAARTGVYQYGGREVDPENKHGLRDTAVVNVLRDEQTVFDEVSVASFIGKPITDDHPKVPVTKDNWRDHARGTIMGAKWEPGGYLAFDLLLTDADAIAKVDSGKRELSNGYDAGLEFGEFKAADGTICQARQTSIRGNHIALVDRGRAGPECRIADSAFAVCDANPEAVARLSNQEKTVKKITLDGLQVDLSDADAVAAAISKLQDKAQKAETALADAQKEFDKQLGAKDAEIADLKTKVVDEATIDARAEAKAAVVEKAKAALGDKAPDFKGKSVADVRRAAVAAKFGDAAVADKSDDYVEARFDAMTADAGDKQPVQPLGTPVITGDAAALADQALAKANDDLNAWRAA